MIQWSVYAILFSLCAADNATIAEPDFNPLDEEKSASPSAIPHLNSDTQVTIYEDLKRKLKSSYQQDIRPFFGKKPVDVEISLYISSLRSVSEQSMDFKVELYYREFWYDPRLSFNPRKYKNLTVLPLPSSLSNLFWLPDTFLPNAIKSQDPDPSSLTHKSLMRLYSDGKILLSRRLGVTAECPMHLALYPFDQQSCRLSIESYGSNTEEIIYHWGGSNPIKVSKEVTLPDLTLQVVKMSSRNITLSTGTYSRLDCCFVFRRNAGFPFIQTFIPGVAIVVISWITLWLEKESPFGGMIDIILAIVFLYNSYSSSTPKVSYLKAMDIFLSMCFLYVLASLAVSATLKFAKESMREQAAMEARSVNEREPLNSKDNHAIYRKSVEPKCLHRWALCSRRITMVLFPTSFLTFNIAWFLYIALQPDLAQTACVFDS